MADQFITFLPCADLSRSRAFYCDLIGLKLTLDQGQCLILEVSGGAFLGLCKAEEAVQPDRRIMLTFVEADLAARYAQFLREGIVTDGPPRDNPKYQIVHFFAQDPDGYTLEFQRFYDPRWQP